MAHAANTSTYAECGEVVVVGNPELNCKPKLRPSQDGATIHVTLPCGATGVIRLCGDDHGSGWHYTVDGAFEFGRPRKFDNVERALAWIACERSKLRIEALAESSEMILALAKSCDGDIDGCCRTLRTLLRERTGRDWSVTRGRGTGYSWLRIHVPPKRRVGYGTMRIDDQILLSAALGSWVHDQGESIRTESGVRGAYIFRAAGLPIPSDWQIAEKGWD